MLPALQLLNCTRYRRAVDKTMALMCGLPNMWIRYWICARSHIGIGNNFETEIHMNQITCL